MVAERNGAAARQHLLDVLEGHRPQAARATIDPKLQPGLQIATVRWRWEDLCSWIILDAPPYPLQTNTTDTVTKNGGGTVPLLQMEECTRLPKYQGWILIPRNIIVGLGAAEAVGVRSD